ncbi:MAG: hypothetical protein IPK13_07020 [Deltaproteobacteria bacterium]|nr:hypothetical protein [Deltaproteobacteria bacterium]
MGHLSQPRPTHLGRSWVTSWVGLCLWMTPAFAASPDPSSGGSAADRASQPPSHLSGAVLSPSELEAMGREIRALRSLLADRLPDDFELPTLFEVNLDDANAVQQRIAQLSERTTEDGASLRRDYLVLSRTSSVSVEGLRLLTRTTTTSSSAVELARVRARVSPDDVARIEAAQKRLDRNRLRLEWLRLPAPQRAAQQHADQKRQAIREDQRNARRAREEAARQALEAEVARQAALEDARRAASEAQKSLARERARIESIRGDLASLRGTLALERERQVRIDAEILSRDQMLAQRVLEASAGSRETDALYDDVVDHVSAARERFSEALGGLFQQSRVPDIKLEIDLGDRLFDEFREGREAVESLIKITEEEASTLGTTEEAVRWDHAAALAQDVQFINGLRLQLIPKLSLEKRDEVMGIGREGFAQLMREVDHLLLTTRWYGLSSLRTLRNADSYLKDFFSLGRATWEALKFCALIGVFIWVMRRHRRWLDAFRPRVVAKVQHRNRNLLILVERWFAFLHLHGWSVGMLVLVYVVFGRGSSRPEITVLRSVVVGYAWYRVLLALAHHVITGAARGRGRTLKKGLSERILRTAAVIGRYVFGIYVLLTTSRRVLGVGYLYNLVTQFFWVGSIPIAFVLLQRWREDIAKTYLRLYPKGRFAQSVEKTRQSPLGFFVAVAAFGTVAARGLSVYARNTLLRFDQTRRALAFLFKRRLEKKAASQGHGTIDLGSLPKEILIAFDEESTEDEMLLVDHWPKLDAVVERLSVWIHDEELFSVALIGERGAGKTSWLSALQRRASIQTSWIALRERPSNPRLLAELLSSLLGFAPASDLDVLRRNLLSGPRRLVIIDHGQALFLRAVDGTEVYEAFTDLVSATGHHVCWVVSFSKYAWAFLDQRYRSRNLFSLEIALPGWPEQKIGELVERRMKRAGYEANYEDLVLDQVPPEDIPEEIERAAERFHRLLWDYSDGNPRVAMHFWKRSLLVGAGREVKVRLFAPPDESPFDALEEESRFVLAAVVIHENLTALEVSRTLAYAPNVCQTALTLLKAEGILSLRDGRYRAEATRYRSIVRYLKRKNLIQG